MSLQVRNDELRELYALRHIVQSMVEASTSTTVALQAAAGVLNAALTSAQAAAATAQTARDSLHELMRLHGQRKEMVEAATGSSRETNERNEPNEAAVTTSTVRIKKTEKNKRKLVADQGQVSERKRAKATATMPTSDIGDDDYQADDDQAVITLPLQVCRGLVLHSLGTPVHDRAGFRAQSGQFEYIYNDGYRVVRTLGADTEIVLEICDHGGDVPVFVLTAPNLAPFTGFTATHVWDEYQRAVAPDNPRRVSGPALFGLKNGRIAKLLRATVRKGRGDGGAASADESQ